jgi:hypothetical protein
MKANVIQIDKQALAVELATWRLRTARTPQEAADLFGVSRYSILRVENCKDIGLAMAYRISAALAKAIREEQL